MGGAEGNDEGCAGPADQRIWHSSLPVSSRSNTLLVLSKSQICWRLIFTALDIFSLLHVTEVLSNCFAKKESFACYFSSGFPLDLENLENLEK